MDTNANERHNVRTLPYPRGGRGPRPHARQALDAVRPAALARQDLDRRRPVWLADDAAMPSERVWRILTKGPHAEEGLTPWAAFQTVLTGLANAGWSRVHVERALQDWRSPGTPGHWLDAQRGRDRQFDRAWGKAITRVTQRPADPRQGRHAEPSHDRDVLALLDEFRERITHDAFLPAGLRLLSTGRQSVEERVVLYALDALARDHLSALPLTDGRDGILVAASGRSLTLLTNWSQRPLSRRLRALCGLDGDVEGRRSLIARLSRGSRGDAATYVLRPRGQVASCSQISSLGERSMSDVALVRSVLPPDMDLLRHDLFVPDVPSGLAGSGRSKGLGLTTALVVSLLATNTEGLSRRVLATVAGRTEKDLEPVLRDLLAFGRWAHKRGPVLVEEDDDRISLASTHVDSLVDDLDAWAATLGLAGILCSRQNQVESERRAFHRGKRVQPQVAHPSGSRVPTGEDRPDVA